MKRSLLITVLIFMWVLSANPVFAEDSNKTELSNQVLVLIEQGYIPFYLSPFNWRGGKTPHTLVYVIGNSTGKEFFTFPVPDTEDKWMSPREAKEYNETNEK